MVRHLSYNLYIANLTMDGLIDYENIHTISLQNVIWLPSVLELVLFSYDSHNDITTPL